jgi:hypothetical protein
MAGDDSRALARPARTYGMNLGGFFRWRSVLSLQGASRYLGSAPPEGGKISEKCILISPYTEEEVRCPRWPRGRSRRFMRGSPARQTSCRGDSVTAVDTVFVRVSR